MEDVCKEYHIWINIYLQCISCAMQQSIISINLNQILGTSYPWYDMILANTELVFDKTNNLKLSILEELRILIYSRYVSRSSF